MMITFTFPCQPSSTPLFLLTSPWSLLHLDFPICSNTRLTPADACTYYSLKFQRGPLKEVFQITPKRIAFWTMILWHWEQLWASQKSIYHQSYTLAPLCQILRQKLTPLYITNHAWTLLLASVKVSTFNLLLGIYYGEKLLYLHRMEAN